MKCWMLGKSKLKNLKFKRLCGLRNEKLFIKAKPWWLKISFKFTEDHIFNQLHLSQFLYTVRSNLKGHMELSFGRYWMKIKFQLFRIRGNLFTTKKVDICKRFIKYTIQGPTFVVALHALLYWIFKQIIGITFQP